MSKQKLVWKTVKVALGKLKPWVRNPRESTQSDADGIGESLDEFGYSEVLLIGPGFELYDGHQRLPVMLQKYGAKHVVECRQSNRALTETERRKLTAFLHAKATGRWNWDALSSWDGQELKDWGFDRDALKNWKTDVNALDKFLKSEQDEESPDVEPEIDRAEELREKWGVEVGQLWVLGDHRIVCGDCTDGEVVKRVMQGNKAQMCFTSPPYNAGISAKLRGNTSIDDNLYREEYNDNKTQSEYLDLLCGFTDLALNNCDYVFVNIQSLAGNKHAFIEYWHHYSDRFCDVAIWRKRQAQPAASKRVMDSIFEFILVFGGNGSRAVGTRDFRGMVRNVFEGDAQHGNEYSDLHAATMPLYLPEAIISTFTNDGELIYEPFCGTGTTIIACENLKRKCRAIEISPAYVAVALERWSNLTGKTPVLEGKTQRKPSK